ncbi:hypothetical protein [Enterococcus wangshanyuanii]|uniref:Uncharacterized protein n=1 Tax=Enterococcus wangshanyuanii TaxID=2005703 RepID=A0ABQ1PVE9_9ENTE|nr:hypothetical protein [Enterococcus wangshanyuanii]GGD04622.1 hypothetical protein GCM10011573_37660 [Enterococcus wangshanyuanii]
MFSHVRVGMNFLFTGIYNNTFSILLLLILLAILLLKMNKQLYIMIGLLIGLLSLMYLLPNFSGTFIQIYTLEVRRFFTLHGFSLAIKNYLIFSIFFGILGILVYRASSYKLFSLLCMLAAVLSLVMLWFSPTLFASGNRVFACANILFIIIGFDLFSKVIEKIKVPRNVALALFSIYPIINLGLPLFIGTPK